MRQSLYHQLSLQYPLRILPQHQKVEDNFPTSHCKSIKIDNVISVTKCMCSILPSLPMQGTDLSLELHLLPSMSLGG